MKKAYKCFSVILAVSLIVGILPFSGAHTFAADVVNSGTCGENLTWEFDNEGTLIISGTGEMGDYSSFLGIDIIPPWELLKENIKNVYICNGVTSIGPGAFEGYSGIISVTIPRSVEDIGYNAFYGCAANLENIYLDTGNKVYHVDNNCLIKTSTKELILGCKNSIIPTDGSVTSISSDAFSGCTGLSSIIIPESVTNLYSSVFSGCSGLESISVDPRNTVFHSDNNCLIKTSTKELILGCKNSVIPTDGSVTSISYLAFSGCTELSSVTIPKSVTTISSGAFSNCSGLESISVDSDNTVFHFENNCLIKTSTKELILGCKNSVIPSDGSVTSIGANAFSGCTGLSSVTIPDGVTYIDNTSFSGCDGIENISVSSGNSVYHSNNNCLIETSTKELILGCKKSVIPSDGSVTSIGKNSFSGCSGLTSITIPARVTTIDRETFIGCNNLKTVSFADGTTNIENAAFSNISSITTVTIPDSVTSIGMSAFRNCVGLTSITIPDSVTYIGSGAFLGCTRLESLNIGAGVTRIGSGSFESCSGIERITVSSGNPIYHSDGNCLIETRRTENVLNSYLVRGGNLVVGCKNSIIPADGSVTSIGSNAFKNCVGLISIIIPDSVTGIGSDAFSGCSGLTSINLPDSITGIGSNAFSGCFGLTSITIPDSVTNLGNYAFKNCVSLTSVIIGNGVKSIDNTVFSGCSGITSVIIGNSVTDLNNNAFRSSSANLESLTVTQGNTVYHSASNCIIKTSSKKLILGCKNSTIPSDGSITSIGYEAFLNCSGLTAIGVPDSITTIDDYALGYESTENGISTPIENFTIYGKTDSVAENYARENSFTFIEFSDCKHESTMIRRVQSATCGLDGYTGDDYCEFCGVLISNGEPIAATGDHTWNTGEIITPATCAAEGVKTFTCTVCNTTKTEAVAKNTSNHTGGTEVRNAKSATCTEAGYTGDTYCKGCGAKLASGSVIPATGHTYGGWTEVKAATCTEKGSERRVCANDSSHIETREIAVLGHGETELRNANAATCTDAGYTGDTYCKVCGERIAEGTAIAALGHGETEVRNAKSATCTEAGYTGDTYCKVCNTKIADGAAVPALGHVDKDDDGVCDVCSTVLTTPEPPTQHTTEPGDETATQPSGDTTTLPADESTTQSSGETTTQPAGGTTTEPISDPISGQTTVPDDQSTTTQPDNTDNTEKPTIPDNIFENPDEVAVGSSENSGEIRYSSKVALTKSAVVASIVSFEGAVVTVKDKDGNELADGATVGTGSTVTVAVGTVTVTKVLIFVGDVDGNGAVNATDARLALRAAAKLDTLEGAFASAADTDGDDNINATDARMILRAAAKLDDPVGWLA